MDCQRFFTIGFVTTWKPLFQWFTVATLVRSTTWSLVDTLTRAHEWRTISFPSVGSLRISVSRVSGALMLCNGTMMSATFHALASFTWTCLLLITKATNTGILIIIIQEFSAPTWKTPTSWWCPAFGRVLSIWGLTRRTDLKRVTPFPLTCCLPNLQMKTLLLITIIFVTGCSTVKNYNDVYKNHNYKTNHDDSLIGLLPNFWYLTFCHAGRCSPRANFQANFFLFFLFLLLTFRAIYGLIFSRWTTRRKDT